MRKLITAAIFTVISTGAYAGCAPEIEVGIDHDLGSSFSSSRTSSDDEWSFGIKLKWDLGHKHKCNQERYKADNEHAQYLETLAKTRKIQQEAREKEEKAKQEELEYLEDLIKLCEKGVKLNSPAIINKCKAEGIIQ